LSCGTITGANACTNTCASSFIANGICQDGGIGSSSSACQLGTDCTDCGPFGNPVRDAIGSGVVARFVAVVSGEVADYTPNVLLEMRKAIARSRTVPLPAVAVSVEQNTRRALQATGPSVRLLIDIGATSPGDAAQMPPIEVGELSSIFSSMPAATWPASWGGDPGSVVQNLSAQGTVVYPSPAPPPLMPIACGTVATAVDEGCDALITWGFLLLFCFGSLLLLFIIAFSCVCCKAGALEAVADPAPIMSGVVMQPAAISTTVDEKV
jgi:hypothetical protein